MDKVNQKNKWTEMGFAWLQPRLKILWCKNIFILQSTQIFKTYNKKNTHQNHSGEFPVCINSNQTVSHFDWLFSYRKCILKVVDDANTKLSLTPPAYLSSDGPFDLDLFLRPLWPGSITGWAGPWLAVVGCSQLKKLILHQNNTTF